MAIEIRFTLSEQDTDYFRRLLEEAQNRASDVPEDQILENVRLLLDRMDQQDTPDFVRKSLGQLRSLTSMLGDPEWPLAPEERSGVLGALTYFYEASDAIDDDIPALGLIDDAIVTELVARELQHELEAYQEFCQFRSISEQLGQQDVSREAWLREKRHEIFERMRQRRERMGRMHRGEGRLTGFSLS